jgi:hypothetical protein
MDHRDPKDRSFSNDQFAAEDAEDEKLARAEAEQARTLVPPEIAAQLPPLYSQEEQGDNAIAVVKFFTPWTNWTWYASEYDPEKRLCFGVVVGHEREFGYFSIDELEEIRGPGGLTIERGAGSCHRTECASSWAMLLAWRPWL